MYKGDLITSIAQRTGVPKKTIDRVLNAFQATVADSLSKGESVVLVGFGTFKVRHTAERSGRHPQTGEPITLSASRLPAFRPGTLLKEKVR